ncbi:uncharacterized protein LOC119559673 isoform X2 [Drosophila subpulchrella]|uniref:uncharacterized protein LOC119559673 isoform X2 n=1 Tax=Drosophila subpulchrella TaxID=1486046 RepID=UPI0018A19A0C|nr:uncharacterized protein LOC119559673 isoform X2 [Drosophila subpulchrella]
MVILVDYACTRSISKNWKLDCKYLRAPTTTTTRRSNGRVEVLEKIENAIGKKHAKWEYALYMKILTDGSSQRKATSFAVSEELSTAAKAATAEHPHSQSDSPSLKAHFGI